MRRAREEKGRGVGKKNSTARKVGRVIKSVLKTAVAVVLTVALVGGNFMIGTVGAQYSRMVNEMLGIEQSWDNSGVDSDGLDLQYNKADYTQDTIKDAQESLDRQLTSEGIVLAQNDDDTLPLAAGTTLSFFSINSRSLGGSTSLSAQYTGGTDGDNALADALADHGLSLNQDLADFYTKGEGKDYVQGAGSQSWGVSEDFRINECPLSVMRDAGVLSQGNHPGLCDEASGR